MAHDDAARMERFRAQAAEEAKEAQMNPPKKTSGWIPALCLAILLGAGGICWKLYESDQLKIKMEQHSQKYRHAYGEDCDLSSGCARKEINGGHDPFATK